MGGLIKGTLGLLGLTSTKMPKVETPVQAEIKATETVSPDNSAALAAAEERRKRQAAAGGGTILTSPLGAAGNVNTQKKTLLG
jgi:hypothetical protein